MIFFHMKVDPWNLILEGKSFGLGQGWDGPSKIKLMLESALSSVKKGKKLMGVLTLTWTR